MYGAAKIVGDGRNMDYVTSGQVLQQAIPGLAPANGNRGEEDPAHWVMWTSAAQDNPGQARFLDYTERELHWAVRRRAPYDSFLVDPAGLVGPTSDPGLVRRLTRFDASIGFAIGRLAERRRIVLVSDSFALAEALHLSYRLRSRAGLFPEERNVLAFFGRALDPRWQKALREWKDSIAFVDLDLHENELFGRKELPRADDLDY
ncbi:MAG: hypothetical protein HY854_12930 [Burkholderiales bacterium]|nr:hypothetical protein [Burkholderiales bacterium]